MSRQPAWWRRMLRRVVVVAAVAAMPSLALATPAPAQPPEGQIRAAGTAKVVPDSYIVVLKDTAVAKEQVGAKSHELGARFGGRVGHTYRDALRGFEVKLPEAAARRLAADPAVAYVQHNAVYRLDDIRPPTPGSPGIQSPSPFGLDRIGERSPSLDRTYVYPSDGAGVTAYVIDSGIRVSHTEFGGRARWGYDAINGGIADDLHGHGTAVASIIGGATYGVAKGVTLVAVRVADAAGNMSTDTVMAGVDWVTLTHQQGQPAVANMSLSGDTSIFISSDEALDDAVRASIADGITYAVSAGNQATDACDRSPARVSEAITVGSSGVVVNGSELLDVRADTSNYGSCLDLFAPGAGIPSASIDDDTDHDVLSGTSAAAPHVTGAAALVLAMYGPLSPQLVRDNLVNDATTGLLADIGPGSPNRLLYMYPLLRLAAVAFEDQLTQVNVPFSAQMTASGGYRPYSWTVAGLPSGVTIDPATGVISGTPTVTGQFRVTYTVHDNQGQQASKSFTWTTTARETKLFTGSGDGPKPGDAIELATQEAEWEAASQGFGGCTRKSTSTRPNELGGYDATVTMSCYR